MKFILFGFLATVALTFGKIIPKDETAIFLSEIPRLINLTKVLEAKNIPVSQVFPKNFMKVDKSEVNFIYYSREDPEGTKVDLNDADIIMTKTKFNKNLESVFLIHGWQNTCASTICTLIDQVLLKKADFNYFTVCWDTPANKNYLEAHGAVSQVGQFLGDFINALATSNEYDLSKVRVIGHSLGAHIAGWAGKVTKGQLSYIMGLDPAGPLFTRSDRSARLDETDARHVEAIHTDGVLVTGLGVSYSVGHVDFWPNGGAGQPGCGSDIIGTCAHSRSYLYFAESLTDNQFFSRKCNDYKDYTKGACKKNDVLNMGGLEYSTSSQGDYYLETTQSSPYGLGDIGL